MVYALKVAISLFFGLLTFLLPFLRGGEQELGVVGRAAVFFGIVPMVIVLLVFGTDWLKTKAAQHARALWIVFAVGSIATIFYLWVYLREAIPSPALFWTAVCAFGVVTLVGSALLTTLGFLIAERYLADRKK
jgi:hypothetical protein